MKEWLVLGPNFVMSRIYFWTLNLCFESSYCMRLSQISAEAIWLLVSISMATRNNGWTNTLDILIYVGCALSSVTAETTRYYPITPWMFAIIWSSNLGGWRENALSEVSCCRTMQGFGNWEKPSNQIIPTPIDPYYCKSMSKSIRCNYFWWNYHHCWNNLVYMKS